jgi:hypothetical protein
MGEVWQDGKKVAATYGTKYAQVNSETAHYAAQYAQDGPVTVRLFEKRGKRWMLVGNTDR